MRATWTAERWTDFHLRHRRLHHHLEAQPGMLVPLLRAQVAREQAPAPDPKRLSRAGWSSYSLYQAWEAELQVLHLPHLGP